MTPERFRKLQDILRRRQPDLTLLLDNVHKPHNLSAIVRSCDAVGVFEIHAVSRLPRVRARKGAAAGAGKWINIRRHADLTGAAHELKQADMQILAAHLSDSAVDFRDIDYTRPTAIMLGAELDGVSEQGLQLADQHIIIPMLGMVGSLNVSVAAALILFEAQRQRRAAGRYDVQRLDPQTYSNTLFEWTHPEFAALYQRKRIPYPSLDEDGNLIETELHLKARLNQ